MKFTVRMLLITWLVLAWICPAFAASPYSNNANLAVQWLSSHQNIDGSWGEGDTKYSSTSEAILALQAMNQRNSAYYWGISWLENHSPANSDFMARRILALAPHGDNVSAEVTSLQTAQALAQPGNASWGLTSLQTAQIFVSPGNNGWGLTSAYQGSPLDSALALLAYSQQNVTTNVPAALAYLKSAQLTTANDMGWPVAQETASDPATTALVVLALVANRSSDTTLNANIANGVTALSAKVGDDSPAYLQALAALAYLKAGYMVQGTALLNSLAAAQAGDGSQGQDAYATALMVRAMGIAMGTDLSALAEAVFIPDPNLRAAINSALGRNNMDALTKGDLANLTTLNAQNRGITNLTGLEWAINLTSLDLRGNNISSFEPLGGLTNLSQIQTDSTLTASKTGTGGGTITSSPVGISCGGACALMFTFGTTITLTATPDVNSIFAGWSGACSGTGACQVTMSENKTVTATFNILPPVAAFTSSATTGTTPLIATFTDQSQRATSWSWNFGDGSESNAQNPSHVYTKPGTYIVTLTATNASGSATTQQTITTSACQNQPVRIAETNIFYPSLTSALGAVADGQTIQLQGWNFLESAIISKSVTLDGGYDCGFASKVGKSILEGEFRISGGSVRMKDVRIAGAALSALPVISVAPPTDSFGNVLVNSASGTHTFTIANSGGANLTIGTITRSGANPGEFVITADACSGTALTPGTSCSVQAAFAPIAAGARTAALSITSNDTATPTAQITLTGIGINPAITMTKAGAGSGTITSYPAGISCGSACTSSFAPGTVTLSAAADANSLFAGWSGGVCSGTGDCSVMLTADTQVTASFNQLPVTVDFSATPQTGSDPLFVAFTNLSHYASTWQWDFGDGVTSTDFNPTHVYRTPGTYSATLTVGNASGSTSTQKTINITACQTLPVRIPETNAYYADLAAALSAVADYQTIQLQDRTFIESNAIGKTITLEGGYDCGYSTRTGKTVLKGAYRINAGAVTMKDIRIVK